MRRAKAAAPALGKASLRGISACGGAGGSGRAPAGVGGVVEWEGFKDGRGAGWGCSTGEACGGEAGLTKIVGRADEAAAEVVLPDAVDDDAGGERVGGGDDPVGQRAAETGGLGVGGFEGRAWFLSAEDREEGGFDGGAGGVGV